MSDPSPWLSAEEVGVLTGLAARSWKAQCRKLAAMGVPFRPNGAGRGRKAAGATEGAGRMRRSTIMVDTNKLTVLQILVLAKQRELSARMTLRAAARLQGEADALRKEAKRRRRAEREQANDAS